MTEITIDWNAVSKKKWQSLLSQAERCSFQQAWAYGAIFEHSNIEVNRFVAYEGRDVVAIGQIITRRFLGFFKLTLLLKGPVWLKNIKDDQKQKVLNIIRQKYPLKYFNLFAFSPEDTAQETYKNMGFRQVTTGNSTITIDLTQSEDRLWQNLYGKNRTHIRKAKKSEFDVVYGDHAHPHTDWLLGQERKQQKEKKYQGLPVEMVKGYGQFMLPDQGVYTAFAVKGGEAIAGALFLRHGSTATYHIGWNGPEGRKSRALNLLLWNMILKLKAAGVENLDLGGLNTEEGADIARYKLSFGGEVLSMGGTFM
ncbi:MAG: peptidoglycan bridge formation glycyltransferase FemA/FemB family protein [Emcibacter sp.]|nr:peptidoglycan bridge formation glycyltransferase FemA/FemB family protein [Emcibacter sp.]